MTTAAAALALLTLPSPTKAAFLSIDDTNPNETITVSANDFEGGLSINGAAFQSGLRNPVTGNYDETPNGITFNGSWLSSGQASGSGTIAFTESDVAGAQVISDILTYSYSNDGPFGYLTGSFFSDIEGSALVTTAPITQYWPESQGAFHFDTAFLTASANSDAEPTPDAGPGVLGSLTMAAVCGLGALKNIRRKIAA